ncbi:MAG: FkbM family methyltransferase [Verrucomicrobiota bacterium]|nr:FkbM family methyltransferase [Verrucomicrobiota bacterium]
MIKYIDKYFLKKPKLRRFVTHLIEGSKNRKIELLGSTVTVNSIEEHGYLRSSRFINSSAFLREEIPVLLNIANLIDDNDTFVDVGANIGVFSVLLSRLNQLNKNFSIYAFEANPKTYLRLKDNCLDLPVKTKNIAISNDSLKLTFIEGAVSHVFTTIENKSEYSLSNKTVSVPSTTLDNELVQSKSYILKIDVEGQEMQVLEGSNSLLNKTLIKAIFIDGFSDSNLPSFLQSHRFKLFNAKTLLPYNGYDQQILAIHKNFLKL